MNSTIILTSCISSTKILISELGTRSFELFMPEKSTQNINTLPHDKNILLLFPEVILRSNSIKDRRLEDIFFEILSTRTNKTIVILTAQIDWLKEYVDFTHMVINKHDLNKSTPCPLFIIKFMNFYQLFTPINEYLMNNC